MSGPWPRAAVVVGALLVACVVASRPGDAACAQEPAVISGEVHPGPGYALPPEGVLVQLIEAGAAPSVAGETRTIDGRFRFELPSLDPDATYLVRAQVEGVGYIAPAAVRLTPQRPTAEVEVVVFGATSERPELRSSMSALTVAFVDLAARQVTLQREDIVVNPDTRTWIGDGDGVTLRLPASAQPLRVESEVWYDGLPAPGEVTADGDALAGRVPVRPGETLVITRYTVPFDLDSEVQTLAVEAALPTDRLRLFVPERYASRLVPLDGAVRGDPLTIEGERLFVVERSGPLRPGDTLSGRAEGFGGRLSPSPLTSRAGAALGAALAFSIIGAGGHAVFVLRGRRRPAPSAV